MDAEVTADIRPNQRPGVSAITLCAQGVPRTPQEAEKPWQCHSSQGSLLDHLASTLPPNEPDFLRCEHRHFTEPDVPFASCGFRLALDLE